MATTSMEPATAVEAATAAMKPAKGASASVEAATAPMRPSKGRRACMKATE